MGVLIAEDENAPVLPVTGRLLQNLRQQLLGTRRRTAVLYLQQYFEIILAAYLIHHGRMGPVTPLPEEGPHCLLYTSPSPRA